MFRQLSIGHLLINEQKAITKSTALEKHFNDLANGEMKDFIKMIPLNRR
ncbi:hypothetical protein J2T03_001621 [Chryseobacterium lathyri]|nr:hypothetical protein [Chryseobacterium lathyri]